MVIRKEISDRRGEASSLNNLGAIGNEDESKQLHHESLAISRAIGDRKGEAVSLINLGNIAKTRGDLAEAERLKLESRDLKIDMKIPIGDGWTIDTNLEQWLDELD